MKYSKEKKHIYTLYKNTVVIVAPTERYRVMGAKKGKTSSSGGNLGRAHQSRLRCLIKINMVNEVTHTLSLVTLI